MSAIRETARALRRWALAQAERYGNLAPTRTAIAVLSLLAGVLGSLYADEIKSSWPLCCWSFRLTGYRLSIQALAFWASALAATLAFIAAQMASDIRRERSEARLSERAASLEELIRTMPPADFIQLLVTTDLSARQTLLAVKDTPDPDLVKADVKEAIRVVLHGLAVLARRFDAGSLGAAYAANIMLFKTLTDLGKDDPAQLLPPNGRLRFTPKGSPLQGVLDLDLELSAMPRVGAAPEEKPDPDPLLKPLALPVPERGETRGPAPDRKLRVLPGAPLAFVLAQEQDPPFIPILDLQADTLTLSEDWFKTFGDFRATEITELDGYFRGEVTGRVRSFVSIPLRRPSTPTQIVGVLNIHCDQPNILRTGRSSPNRQQANPSQQFAHLIDPILQILAELLDYLQKARA